MRAVNVNSLHLNENQRALAIIAQKQCGYDEIDTRCSKTATKLIYDYLGEEDDDQYEEQNMKKWSTYAKDSTNLDSLSYRKRKSSFVNQFFQPNLGETEEYSYVIKGKDNKEHRLYKKVEVRNNKKILSYRSLFADIDFKDEHGNYYQTSEEVASRQIIAEKRLKEFFIPNIIVRTGNGLQVYWTLKKNKLKQIDWKKLEAELLIYIKTYISENVDLSVSAPAQLLRLWNSVHWKPTNRKDENGIPMEIPVEISFLKGIDDLSKVTLKDAERLPRFYQAYDVDEIKNILHRLTSKIKDRKNLYKQAEKIIRNMNQNIENAFAMQKNINDNKKSHKISNRISNNFSNTVSDYTSNNPFEASIEDLAFGNSHIEAFEKSVEKFEKSSETASKNAFEGISEAALERNKVVKAIANHDIHAFDHVINMLKDNSEYIQALRSDDIHNNVKFLKSIDLRDIFNIRCELGQKINSLFHNDQVASDLFKMNNQHEIVYQVFAGGESGSHYDIINIIMKITGFDYLMAFKYLETAFHIKLVAKRKINNLTQHIDEFKNYRKSVMNIMSDLEKEYPEINALK